MIMKENGLIVNCQSGYLDLLMIVKEYPVRPVLNQLAIREIVVFDNHKHVMIVM